MQNLQLSANRKYISAIIAIHGSKSITNRALLLAALSNGISVLHNVPDNAEDVSIMINALKQLGVKLNLSIQQIDHGPSYYIHGCNGIFPNQFGEIFCGNSGTTLRFLTTALALQPDADYVLYGIDRMHERPIADLVDALNSMNCDISYIGNIGCPPLKIKPRRKLYNVRQIHISGAVSSQFISSLLLSLPILNYAPNIKISGKLISEPYIDITRNLLQKFGVVTEFVSHEIMFKHPTIFKSCEYIIEPDASSASYFLSVAAINGDITIKNLGKNSIQGDKNYANILAKMGAIVEYTDDAIQVIKGVLLGGDFAMHDMPDVAMTLAVISLFAIGTTHISGIASWKIKETDRILAMYNELTKLGAIVSYTNDSITITPASKINSGIIVDTYDDHRMAMCFSLLAVGGVDVIINNPECVNKTFPNYFDVLRSIL